MDMPKFIKVVMHEHAYYMKESSHAAFLKEAAAYGGVADDRIIGLAMRWSEVAVDIRFDAIRKNRFPIEKLMDRSFGVEIV